MAEALEPAISERVDRLVNRVLEIACGRSLTLATAESCTGGLLASLLTDVPNRSHAFERAFISYTDDAKVEMLGVSRQLLASETAVSEAVAKAMATGAITASRADIAISVTGYTDRGPDPARPAGRVHFACAFRDKLLHRHEEFGDVGRAAVRHACLEAALEMILDVLGEKRP